MPTINITELNGVSYAWEPCALFSAQVPDIKKVIFNDPATVVIWNDGTKTVVKCMDGDEYSKDVGLAMCISKKVLGSNYKRAFKKWVRNDEI